MKQIKPEIDSQTYFQVRSHVLVLDQAWHRAWKETHSQASSLVCFTIGNQTRRQIREQIWNGIGRHIMAQIKQVL